VRFDVLTIFPEVFDPYLNTSILGRAQEKKLIEPHVWDIRDYADDKHKTVDDTPYGGGPGMILKIAPIADALDAIKVQSPNFKVQKRRIVVLSARGKQFDQQKAKEYSELDQLTLICGRYEGIDQRVIEHLADEELSIGPYVLAGGEIAALAVIEATARLIPGVLGNAQSLVEETFSGCLPREAHDSERSGEYPQYTKPKEYKGWYVPSILLSGDHASIAKWRKDR